MEQILIIIWCVCAFIILWTMIGYPLFLQILDKILKAPPIKKDYNYLPSVTVLVVAHNEEKVIKDKLENLIDIEYPHNKFSIMVTSDFSTDKTNDIVKKFIEEHNDYDIRLHKTMNHGGKTNAQNEAVRQIKSELVIMTDANCIFKKDAIKQIVACFKDKNIKYVCGATIYINSSENRTANSETTYWNIDSRCRDIEGRIQSITAGDGNLYACRTNEYKEMPLIECHDSSFPVLFSLDGGRAVFDPSATVYEKAGENDKDEYKRKVRMNRNLFHNILPSKKILNIFKYKWFTVFWIGHRTCRYLLWFAHIFLLILSGVLASNNIFWIVSFIGQIIFYLLAIIGIIFKINNKYIKLIAYYTMTVFSQLHAIYNIATGKVKPTWSKAESTR